MATLVSQATRATVILTVPQRPCVIGSMASLSFLDLQHELDFQTLIRDGSRAGSDFLWPGAEKRMEAPIHH